MQTVDVIFKKPFNAIPTIVCTLKSGSNITTYGDLTAFVDYGSVTKKGFTIKVSNSCATLGAKPCVSWIATVLWNSKTFGSIKVIGGIDVKGIEITVKSKATFYGVIILSINQDLQLYNIPVSQTTNTTVGQVKIEINDFTMRITFQSKYTHYACILGGSIAKGTIKEIKE